MAQVITILIDVNRGKVIEAWDDATGTTLATFVQQTVTETVTTTVTATPTAAAEVSFYEKYNLMSSGIWSNAQTLVLVGSATAALWNAGRIAKFIIDYRNGQASSRETKEVKGVLKNNPPLRDAVKGVGKAEQKLGGPDHRSKGKRVEGFADEAESEAESEASAASAASASGSAHSETATRSGYRELQGARGWKQYWSATKQDWVPKKYQRYSRSKDEWENTTEGPKRR